VTNQEQALHPTDDKRCRCNQMRREGKRKSVRCGGIGTKGEGWAQILRASRSLEVGSPSECHCSGEAFYDLVTGRKESGASSGVTIRYSKGKKRCRTSDTGPTFRQAGKGRGGKQDELVAVKGYRLQRGSENAGALQQQKTSPDEGELARTRGTKPSSPRPAGGEENQEFIHSRERDVATKNGRKERLGASISRNHSKGGPWFGKTGGALFQRDWEAGQKR